MNTKSICENGVFANQQSQVITDDLVESLLEISSFFMPQGVVTAPVEYVNDVRKAAPLETNIVLAEIATQQILECGNKLSIKLAGTILEGFAKPLEFGFFISHTYTEAKVFRGRNIYRHFSSASFCALNTRPSNLS